MARLIVDRERCIGCGTCVESCPAVFAIGKDRVASVINAHLAITEQACAAEAAADCPQLSIAEVDE
jgi:ferredoxin